MRALQDPVGKPFRFDTAGVARYVVIDVPLAAGVLAFKGIILLRVDPKA